MTMFALLLPWFVLHGAEMPPLHAFIAALLASIGAVLLILVVVHGFGVARLRLATTAVLVVLMSFLYGVGPFFGIPAVEAHQAGHSPARPLLLRASAGCPAGHHRPVQ